MSTGATRSETSAKIRVLGVRADPTAWMTFTKQEMLPGFPEDEVEPEFDGAGIYSLPRGKDKPFYVGYGPFRHLGNTGSRRPARARLSKRAYQVASLFDETVQLADAIDWLIDQHLYQLEEREGAADLLYLAIMLLKDGLLPDGFEVKRIDSDGLWVSNNGVLFPLREMSDGYRTVTALVVDIIRQMWSVHPDLKLHMHDGVPTLPYSGVVLIDEVDAHLHVSWQKKIGTWLKEHFPQIQFIVTTHSPYICQSADPGGLISLPGPRENRPPQVVDEDLYHRVVYGSGDDAILTELFGVDTVYSPEAERLRERLGDLEIKVAEGNASAAEKEEYHTLSKTLTSSLSARAYEIAEYLRRME
jgi:hypothetical protein